MQVGWRVSRRFQVHARAEGSPGSAQHDHAAIIVVALLPEIGGQRIDHTRIDGVEPVGALKRQYIERARAVYLQPFMLADGLRACLVVHAAPCPQGESAIRNARCAACKGGAFIETPSRSDDRERGFGRCACLDSLAKALP
ncbi:hypothetical protein OVY29_11250 [Sphingopyxis sp. SE2]|nr:MULTISPECIES: hypothetical protein [unclassified Sphingopyxis]MDT7529239.1 hypothetical protein [Sphingopyxis sp. SE2]